jgi:ATP/maltotriose-dependent transcriptional regulator MalT
MIETRPNTGAVAVAAGALFDAIVAKRRRNTALSVRAATSAAEAYRKLGWRIFEAFALEIAGDFDRARMLYEDCGAVSDAMRLSRQRTRKATVAFWGARLTTREREVAGLAIKELSNPAIAAALGISTRTVHHHMEAIFGKLGVRARWQIPEALAEPSKSTSR